jgi:beta-hydroxyacyl-ACP dehydratase FabZ
VNEPTAPPRDIRWILGLLPHRYPFLLVDRVLELEHRKRIVAIKNVTFNEQFFQGHFPSHPVFPGVLMIEAMAQAGGLLLLQEASEEERQRKLLYFVSIDNAKFRRPVVPGDQLRFEVEVLRYRTVFCKMAGKALVDGHLVSEVVFASAMVDR